MKKKRRQRVVSILMALLMIVGLVPTDFAVTTARAATTYSFDATTISATGIVDKTAITEGTTFSNGYFKVVGTVTQRVSSTTGATTSIELGKASSGSLQFTITQTASATIVMSSTGSSNTSAVGLADASGNLIANSEAITTVTGTAGTTLTYSNLAAGTYSIVSPLDANNNRGARVLSASVVEQDPVPVSETFGFDATTISGTGITDKTAIAEGTTYANGYYKVVGTVTQRISSTTGATTAIELGKASTGSLQFTVSGTADATIVMSSTGSSNTSAVALTDASGNIIANSGAITTVTGTAGTTLTYSNLTAGTYSIVSPLDANNNRGARILTASVVQTSSGVKPARKAWADVTAPAIGTITSADGKITVPFTMVIGYDGADKVAVTMKDSAGTTIDSKTVATQGTSGSVDFTPQASGNYTFSISASRDGETDKVGTDGTFSGFVLPLTAPTISSATNDGKGGAALTWDAVNGADSYTVSYKKSTDTAYTVAASGITSTSYTVTGLTIDAQYSFVVSAVRNTPSDKKDSLAFDKKITATAEREWKIGYVGTQAGSNKANGQITVNPNGSVDMYASDGKFGSSNDGYEFYYTEVESAKENFTLKATFNLTAIKDNQSGVGLLVADTLGTAGNFELASETNYYLAGVSKTEWLTDGVKTSYSNGTNVRKVTGCTDPTGQDATGRVVDMSSYFQSTLDTTQVINSANLAAGTCQSTFTVTLTKDNNGYYATLEGSDNVIHMYDPSKLLKQDGDKVYVGLAVARGTKATFSNISFESRDPASDPVKDESTWDKEYTPQNLFVYAGSSTGTSDYTYRYYGNWAGQFDLTDGDGNVLLSKYIEAGETVTYDMQLAKGTTKLITTITPDSNKVVLKSYDPVVIEKSVTYKTIGNEGETIVVSADADSSGKGTDASPMDIYSAIKYAQPGQVIYLKDGTYNLTSAVTIPYSVSGTADKMITLMAEDAGQVILDGSQIPEGSSSILNVYGNYWKVYGLDICNSSKNTKGVGVAGNNNIIEMCNIHDNGTTGLQISRSGGEPKEWWPANNLVKNCTSYNNCDPLLNDADGFAAKLTVGDGNKFYGCISYNNIDDGWDLYAKNEVGQGPIGAVVIENSVAYNNGYIPGVGYGEGNGFKLGGEGLPGAHQLINCVSYNNAGKGITSNNGPDCQVINCTSFNNNYYYATGAVTKTSASPNVGLAPLNGTKYNGTTNYVLKNTLSLYTLANGAADQLTVIGQDPLQSENNFLVNDSMKSLNSKGVEATIDWFGSVDTSIAPTREANGTINMHGLLELKPEFAALGIGAKIVTTGDAVSVAPVKTTVITPKTGDMTHIYLFITLSIMSGAALVGLYYYDKKKKTIVRQ